MVMEGSKMSKKLSSGKILSVAILIASAMGGGLSLARTRTALFGEDRVSTAAASISRPFFGLIRPMPVRLQ